MSLKYEPSSEPLYNSAKYLFLNRELYRTVQLKKRGEIGLCLFCLINLVRPGPFSFQDRRVCRAHLACQLENYRPDSNIHPSHKHKSLSQIEFDFTRNRMAGVLHRMGECDRARVHPVSIAYPSSVAVSCVVRARSSAGHARVRVGHTVTSLVRN